MNKFTLSLATATLIFASTMTEARELDPGTIMIGGDTSFEDSSSEISINAINSTEKADTTVLNVGVTYFFARNLGVGLIINNEDTDYSDGTNDSINMMGPVVGYNISLNTETSIILQAGLVFVSGDVDDGTGNSASIDGDGTLLMVSAAYFISDNIAVNIGIRKTNVDIDFTVATLPASAEMSETATNIGLSVFF